MIILPPDLAAVTNDRLAILDAACDRELSREIKKVASPAFHRALRHGLDVEAEIERRQARP